MVRAMVLDRDCFGAFAVPGGMDGNGNMPLRTPLRRRCSCVDRNGVPNRNCVLNHVKGLGNRLSLLSHQTSFSVTALSQVHHCTFPCYLKREFYFMIVIL